MTDKKSKKTTTEKKTQKVEEKNKAEENKEDSKKEKSISKKEEIAIAEITETMKKKNVVPKEELEKINKNLFRNIMIAILIVLYFIFLILGKRNIKNDIYVTDLKVFSMCILFIAIVLIEMAYKKDSGEFAIYGVETIVLSLTTLALIYVNLMFSAQYIFIVSVISFAFVIYYLIKSVIIFIKKKRKYFIDDMKEMINKDE